MKREKKILLNYSKEIPYAVEIVTKSSLKMKTSLEYVL
jgi:hypothetical protein